MRNSRDKSQESEGQSRAAANHNFVGQAAAQRMQDDVAQHKTAQLAGEEEELMQGKFDTAQLAGEEEELMQGKFDTAQLAGEEEELMQGKFDAAQLAGEEEELMQGKFDTAQLAGEEEELMQGKFDTSQLKTTNSSGPVSQLENDSAPAENNTGMSDGLKAGIENLSGVDVSDVRVHYNSSKPAQMNAHAYAQGTNIHVASGQEQHVPHEAWHTVQQKQGRVQANTTVGGAAVNDNPGLEAEADRMGAKANSM